MTHSVALFFLCFVSVFLAELPDKTSLVVMALAARGPFRVWGGAVGALVAQALLAVAFGAVVGHFLGAWLHWLEAAAFVGFAVYLWIQADDDDDQRAPAAGVSLFLTAFTLVFLAEFGDLTQFSIIAWSARLTPAWGVFVTASIALAAAAAVSATVGAALAARLGETLLKRVAALLFLAIALLVVIL